MLAAKKCRRCKSAPWVCRGCGAKCCEHYCSLKTDDGKASCSKCQAAPRRARLSTEERAIRLLINHYAGGHCSWGQVRADGESCAEYMTARQGVLFPGCDHCETEDLLREIGRLPERR